VVTKLSRITDLSLLEDAAQNPDFDSVQLNMLLASVPVHELVKFVYLGGRIECDGVDVPVDTALWDSGALHASYISQDFLNRNLDVFGPHVRESRSDVRMASGNERVKITQHVDLTVVFPDASGKEHGALLRFFVLPESENDILIGLPAIVVHFGSIYLERIRAAVDTYGVDSTMHHISLDSPDLRTPWSIPPDGEAPEDLETPLPCSFTDALHFMEMTPDQAKEEYFGQFEEHVAPEFAASTPVLELLRTKGLLVFVPQNWEGIKNIEPLELKWKDDLPTRMKPKARPVNPRLYEAAKREFDRLLGYFYEWSDSSVASCLVIAPKATKPFIRFCGDYVTINKYILTGHYPIPHVQRSLEKIRPYKIYLDLDLVNSFHQFRLAHKTSQYLSVQTPWGQVAPKFMPEGVSPATFVLQEAVTKIFAGFEDWTIVLFDNILVLAHDYDDAYRKLDQILDRCREYNLYLKFSKTWLGFHKVHFFGYDCVHNSYSISPDRQQALYAYKPPTTRKQMQSFLGAALYLKSFVPNYSVLAAPLHEMTKDTFVWNDLSWTHERLEAFDSFKSALLNSFALYYPDYDLPWVMRTDASVDGVGMVLFQIYHPAPDADPEYQVILFASQKFSDQARRWTTIEQEAYGIYFGVKQCAYYLRCKEFILETDHANLQWIEASAVPKVIRWRIYLQSFNFSLRHISGKQNIVADWLSRSHPPGEPHSLDEPPSDDPSTLACLSMLMHHDEIASLGTLALIAADADLDSADDQALRSPQELFDAVHGGRMGHFGSRRTWMALTKYFPGHKIPFRVIEEMVADCGVCQKDRLGMSTALKPIYRTLKTESKRKRVGVDGLRITPADKNGNSYATVIVVEATKLVDIYPASEPTALNTALALFQFFSTYGVYEELISDPGSDLTSEVVAHLNAWFGIRHVFSLVDRHESNGVEGTNKQILRHLRALVADERIADRWSDPSCLCLVKYMINSQPNSETGAIPFHMHFGSDDQTYMKLPELANASETAHEFVKLLDADLRSLWETSKEYQRKLVAERSSANGDPEKQNLFQPGDLVLFQIDTSVPRPSKLTMKYKGPYEVLSQYKNDVQCKHLCMKNISTFHVERLKLYTGTRDSAEKLALLDYDQYEVDEILYYRGNVDMRSNMEFCVRFKDGEERWVTWSQDLFNSVPYETFCRKHSPLFPLLFTVEEAERQRKQINSTAITEVSPGSAIYLDLRERGGSTWYNSIGLPRSAELTYVLPCRYIRWVGREHKKLRISCEVTNEEWTVDHYFVKRYGSNSEFDPRTMVLVDDNLCARYPKILHD
jgi:hypothetical protein